MVDDRLLIVVMMVMVFVRLLDVRLAATRRRRLLESIGLQRDQKGWLIDTNSSLAGRSMPTRAVPWMEVLTFAGSLSAGATSCLLLDENR